MARRNLTAEEAFEVLNRTSQNRNIKLAGLAVHTGQPDIADRLRGTPRLPSRISSRPTALVGVEPASYRSKGVRSRRAVGSLRTGPWTVCSILRLGGRSYPRVVRSVAGECFNEVADLGIGEGAGDVGLGDDADEAVAVDHQERRTLWSIIVRSISRSEPLVPTGTCANLPGVPRLNRIWLR
jgi:hypothetical protein